MAVQSSPVLPQTPKVTLTQFTTASAISSNSVATFTTLYTGGTNGSKITSVMASNTSSNTVSGILTVGSTVSGAALNYVIAAAPLAGVTDLTSAVTSVNLFANATVPLPVDGDGNPYLFLTSTAYTLGVGIGSSIQTAVGRVTFIAIGADF